MDSKFSPGDYVKFENKIFLVKTVVLLNPNIPSDPFVCGLVPAEKPNSFKQLLVREGLLAKAEPPLSQEQVKVLYGDKNR